MSAEPVLADDAHEQPSTLADDAHEQPSTLAEVLPPDVWNLAVKEQQRVYHDWESKTYDEKFSISY
ncbi:MAG: SAM-dependent methyltransferase, partial [Nitriliruptor sp.]